MKILVVNAGSSSLKYQLIDMQTEKALCVGGIERIGIEGTRINHKKDGEKYSFEITATNHTQAFNVLMSTLTDEKMGVIKNVEEISAIGHRYVSAAETYQASTLITDEVLAKLKELVSFAPLHNPANIACIESCRNLLSNVPNVIVLDTGFHATMPKKAALYSIPYEDYEEYKVRRYGYHGTSHKFVSQEAIKYLSQNNLPCKKIITCHLGNGSSISAILDGKSVDTSMGMTPLAGVEMGTRSGDIDVGAAEMLAEKKNMTFKETINYLNKKCGFLGVSGVSSDSRDLVAAAEAGNERAKLAIDKFVYDVKKYIGSYAAALNGVDAIVFTGGIGENATSTRDAILSDMDYLGIKIDKELNEKIHGEFADLAAKDAKVKVLVIPTNEELVIARDTKEVVEKNR